MWGTSSPDDKLTGDLGNVTEATQIGGRRSDRLIAAKLSPGIFGLLQQYLPKAAVSRCSKRSYSITSSAMASKPGGKVRPSVFAVFRLITNSNLVGWMTGKSAGFSPLRIRPQ